MQPYLFPYVGYFSLIKFVDKFVVYEDVNYIKQGWINRNRILVNGEPCVFTVPLSNASSYVPIKDVEVCSSEYRVFVKKFVKTLYQSYKRAPYYENVMELIEYVFSSDCRYISEVATHSIKVVCDYLGIKTELEKDLQKYSNRELKGEDRVIDICKKEKADVYLNAIGGKDLYSVERFKSEGIELKFLKSRNVEYPQFGNTFVPWLSIIDMMMFVSAEEVNKNLEECDLV